jgi:hypothetical protein
MFTLAGLIGGGGLLIFMTFLFRGSYNLLDLMLSEIQVLVFDDMVISGPDTGSVVVKSSVFG